MNINNELMETLKKLDSELRELRTKDPTAYASLEAALRDTLAAINTEFEKS